LTPLGVVGVSALGVDRPDISPRFKPEKGANGGEVDEADVVSISESSDRNVRSDASDEVE
jgi:hypothetical protein